MNFSKAASSASKFNKEKTAVRANAFGAHQKAKVHQVVQRLRNVGTSFFGFMFEKRIEILFDMSQGTGIGCGPVRVQCSHRSFIEAIQDSTSNAGILKGCELKLRSAGVFPRMIPVGAFGKALLGEDLRDHQEGSVSNTLQVVQQQGAHKKVRKLLFNLAFSIYVAHLRIHSTITVTCHLSFESSGSSVDKLPFPS